MKILRSRVWTQSVFAGIGNKQEKEEMDFYIIAYFNDGKLLYTLGVP